MKKDILVVVTSSEINHHMLVSEEKHDCTWVVQLIHFVEVWYLCNVHLHI